MLRTLISILLLLFVLPLHAGNGSGKIVMLMVSSGGNPTGPGYAMFKTENNTDKASCSTTDSGTQWAFSLETEYGRAMYAMLLSAQAQQKSVQVVGANDCAAWGDRERPQYIYQYQ